ncbi:unnamed protein product (macronuclear) [Paramecium tetraurelia]|uniref:Uncharacterized protein n=1 Tax=Paramecium tetraurelia TaxID=5888 RepID=A0BDC9_PARTE|nr:uncharacterized protein GSPATT00027574001 [Paramecium tetraurelia]CAK56546.1 unnamed protein product [Paramecium tetraurelia]|eukprot:XP_001423944.1 hypothetical protein (macronuclear) [Paramecium tetraurelia strain d4-2]
MDKVILENSPKWKKQVIVQIQSVKGIAFEFLALNLTGYLFLSAYSLSGYLKGGENGWPFTGNITLQDLIFALHSVVITILTILQTAYYYKKEDNPGVSLWCIIVLIILWAQAILYIILTCIFGWEVIFTQEKLNVLYWMGYEKLFVTLIKNIPQVYLNYKRKSTVGWSIFNILLAFIGGILSFLQMLIDQINGKSANLVDMNIVKFILSWIVLGFDLIFMFQHYVLYNPKRNKSKAIKDEYQYMKE